MLAYKLSVILCKLRQVPTPNLQNTLLLTSSAVSMMVILVKCQRRVRFVLHACHTTSQAKEKVDLKSNIATLTSELSSLKSEPNSFWVSLPSSLASAWILPVKPQDSHSPLLPSPPAHLLIKSHPSASG